MDESGGRTMPTISVVIATNRESAFLREAIDSVRAQTLPVHEIILVDDGAPASVLQPLAQECGALYVRQPPRGVSAARNHGTRVASGEWVAFLDDDDVWHPERLERQWQVLKGTTAVAACTGGWHLDAGGARLPPDWSAGGGPSSDVFEGTARLPRLITMLIDRATLLDIGGFTPALRFAEDKDVVFRLLSVGEIVPVDEPLVGYRRHGGNTTGSSELVARQSSLRALALQVWAAEARGERANRRALKAMLERETRHECRGAIETGIRLIARGRVASGTRCLRWAVRFGGPWAVGQLLTVPVRMAGRRLPAATATHTSR